MCKEGQGDPYSASETRFYSAEIAELNKSLDEKGKLRQERVAALEEKLPNMSKVPLQEFIDAYKQAVEDLCVRKGYGTEHGERELRLPSRISWSSWTTSPISAPWTPQTA